MSTQVLERRPTTTLAHPRKLAIQPDPKRDPIVDEHLRKAAEYGNAANQLLADQAKRRADAVMKFTRRTALTISFIYGGPIGWGLTVGVFKLLDKYQVRQQTKGYAGGLHQDAMDHTQKAYELLASGQRVQNEEFMKLLERSAQLEEHNMILTQDNEDLRQQIAEPALRDLTSVQEPEVAPNELAGLDVPAKLLNDEEFTIADTDFPEVDDIDLRSDDSSSVLTDVRTGVATATPDNSWPIIDLPAEESARPSTPAASNIALQTYAAVAAESNDLIAAGDTAKSVNYLNAGRQALYTVDEAYGHIPHATKILVGADFNDVEQLLQVAPGQMPSTEQLDLAGALKTCAARISQQRRHDSGELTLNTTTAGALAIAKKSVVELSTADNDPSLQEYKEFMRDFGSTEGATYYHQATSAIGATNAAVSRDEIVAEHSMVPVNVLDLTRSAGPSSIEGPAF